MSDLPRIAVVDIETAPMINFNWGIGKQYVGLDQVIVDWRALSFAWKWSGEKSVHYEAITREQYWDLEDPDAEILASVHALMEEADIIVAHFGTRFDFPRLNARFADLAMPVVKPYRTVDPVFECRKVFGFTSNKLVFLAEKFAQTKKDGHTRYPGFKLWRSCILDDDPRAWKDMRRYNIDDVKSLDDIHLRLRPWWKGYPSVVSHDEQADLRCTTCASKNIQRRGYKTTDAGRYAQYVCNDCGGWSRSRTMDRSMDRSRLLKKSV